VGPRRLLLKQNQGTRRRPFHGCMTRSVRNGNNPGDWARPILCKMRSKQPCGLFNNCVRLNVNPQCDLLSHRRNRYEGNQRPGPLSGGGEYPIERHSPGPFGQRKLPQRRATKPLRRCSRLQRPCSERHRYIAYIPTWYYSRVSLNRIRANPNGLENYRVAIFSDIFFSRPVQ